MEYYTDKLFNVETKNWSRGLNPGPSDLSFLFLGNERDWMPPEGLTPPPGKVFVVESLPGRVVAAGKDREEAHEKLEKALIRAMGDNPRAWFADALDNLRLKHPVQFFMWAGMLQQPADSWKRIKNE